MQFPDDEVCIARGKYSTASKERREQLGRVQKICTTLITEGQAALRDCELRPPVNQAHVDAIVKCYENLIDARARIIEATKVMIELEPAAWGKVQEDA